MALGLVLGLGLALLRLSRHAALRSPAWCYIWFVRGTPLLLQLVFIYDALRAVGIKLDTFTTAIIGFSLNEAAFCAEIIRGGVLSVNRSQAIAAAALGMPGALTLRRIILPQAMRAILPGIANQAISMIKSTSIASVIMVNELTFRAQQIVGQNFKFFTVFTAAALIYLAMTSCVAVSQIAAERRFDFLRERGDGLFARLAGAIGLRRRPKAAGEPQRPARRHAAGHRLPQRPEGLWRSASPAKYRSDGQQWRGGRDHGAERLRQKHAAAHDQPSRTARLGRNHRRRQACRLPADARRRLAAHRKSRSGARGSPHRHGVSAFQSVRAPDGAGKSDRGADPGLSPTARTGSRNRPSAACRRRPSRSCRSSAAPPVRRSAAARRDRPGARGVAAGHAVRRADIGARSRAGRRGAWRNPRPRRGRNDDDHCHT